MDNKTMIAIAETTSTLEEYLNEKISKAYHQFGPAVAVNVMVNLSANLMAKSLLMAPDDEMRERITYIAAISVEDSLKEGMAAVHTHLTISKAMGSTCSPRPPKKD